MTEAPNARERSRIETRKRLMEKGAELFAERGFANTRATDVAKAAGVAVGTLYLHFGDKRALLRAILFEGVEGLLNSLRRLAENPPEDLSEAVQKQSELMVQFAEDNPRMGRLLFDPESVRSRVSTEFSDYLVSMQEKRLRARMAAGQVSPELDPVVASHALVGMYMQVLDWWTRNPGGATREAVVDTLTRLRLSGFH